MLFGGMPALVLTCRRADRQMSRHVGCVPVSLHLEANVTIYLGHGVNQICGKCRKKSHDICDSVLAKTNTVQLTKVRPSTVGALTRGSARA